MLIYHTGIAPTVYLGFVKITSLFLFAFSALIVAPRFYYSPDESNWAAIVGRYHCGQIKRLLGTNKCTVLVGGAIPLLFVSYTTAPFVSYVHIRLPIFARQSHEHLMRWSRNITSSTEVDLTTMRLYGLPRVTRVPLAELQERNRKFLDVANLVRLPSKPPSSEKRPWWMGREMTRFFVSKEQKTGDESAIWPKVLEAIRRQSNNASRRKI